MTNSDPNSTWLYNPNFPLSLIFSIFYTIPMTIPSIQTFFLCKSYYFIAVLFGVCLEVGGYIVRAVSIKNQSSIVRHIPCGLPSLHPTTTPQLAYAISSCFIVPAPHFIGAGNYLLITCFCKRVLPSRITHIHRIPTSRLTRIFITSRHHLLPHSSLRLRHRELRELAGSTVKIGIDVLIVGLATQVVTFAFFWGSWDIFISSRGKGT